ncbi:MAG: hypothetical protein KDD84_15105, partial [Caldilineaceae bacterium]|nr:hypothetical protein [Caldilineaceae bacterium]
AELNQSQKTTIVVVTHDRRVAQATSRILRMQDGRIVDDHRVQDPLLEDLRMLAYSRLGQALLNDHDPALAILNDRQQSVLRDMLQKLENGQIQDRNLSTENGNKDVLPWTAETFRG